MEGWNDGMMEGWNDGRVEVAFLSYGLLRRGKERSRNPPYLQSPRLCVILTGHGFHFVIVSRSHQPAIS